jgi:RNA polymerase sigma-70 factor (ECF subfamily)
MSFTTSTVVQLRRLRPGERGAAGHAMTPSDPSPERRPEPSLAERNQREFGLMERIARQDRAAFKELYLLYHRRLARFLTRLTSRYDVVEEIINDTFFVVWQRASDFRGASQVSTWVMGIAYRRGLKTLQRLRPMHSELDHEIENQQVEEPWHQAELSEWLTAGLARLPLEQRMVLELAYHLGHSCEEIAQIMQCPVNTVKTRMFQARRKLKGYLAALAGSDKGA